MNQWLKISEYDFPADQAMAEKEAEKNAFLEAFLERVKILDFYADLNYNDNNPYRYAFANITYKCDWQQNNENR